MWYNVICKRIFLYLFAERCRENSDMGADPGLTLTPELNKLKARLEKIGDYLEKVETRLLDANEIKDKPTEVLREEYKVLKNAQMEGLEFIRKYMVQNRPSDAPEVDLATLALAQKLMGLPKDQLEAIREVLSR